MYNNQSKLDTKNAQFWDELCGSGLAQSLGITEVTPETLQRFDQAYMDYYPYLSRYVLRENITDKKVLEIGLGYGTLGFLLASQGCDYYGLDIADGPVQMMRYRLEQLGIRADNKGRTGSALSIPHDDASFDYVYTIGCLHHTGNLHQAVNEVHRVLVPGGKAIVMLYNRHSFRQLVDVQLKSLKIRLLRKRGNLDEQVRALYDTNVAGQAAPHTEYISIFQARQQFHHFSEIKIDIQNFDAYSFFWGLINIRREWLLGNIARVLGLDLYIVATK